METMLIHQHFIRTISPCDSFQTANVTADTLCYFSHLLCQKNNQTQKATYHTTIKTFVNL